MLCLHGDYVFNVFIAPPCSNYTTRLAWGGAGTPLLRRTSSSPPMLQLHHLLDLFRDRRLGDSAHHAHARLHSFATIEDILDRRYTDTYTDKTTLDYSATCTA